MHQQQQYRQQQQQQHSSSSGDYREVSSEEFVESTTPTTTAAVPHTATTTATPSTPTPYSRPTKYTDESKYEIDWLPILIFVFVAVAFLFHLIALGAPYWATTYDKHFPNRRVEHIGLWKYCVDPIVSTRDGTRDVRYGSSSRQICDDFVNIIYSDWLKASQSFMILSFFTFLPTVGCVAMVLLIASFGHNLMFNAIAIAGMFTCGFFQFITVVIFGCYYDKYFNNKDAAWTGKSGAYLGWAYVIAVFSMAACFCCSAVLILKVMEVKRGKRIDWGLVNPLHQESKKLLI